MRYLIIQILFGILTLNWIRQCSIYFGWSNLHAIKSNIYKSKKDIKFKNYKWKPSNKNSIDFFVKFEKDPQTGKLLNVYDDSSEDNIEGVTYKILNLHVGKVVNNIGFQYYLENLRIFML